MIPAGPSEPGHPVRRSPPTPQRPLPPPDNRARPAGPQAPPHRPRPRRSTSAQDGARLPFEFRRAGGRVVPSPAGMAVLRPLNKLPMLNSVVLLVGPAVAPLRRPAPPFFLLPFPRPFPRCGRPPVPYPPPCRAWPARGDWLPGDDVQICGRAGAVADCALDSTRSSWARTRRSSRSWRKRSSRRRRTSTSACE